MVWERTRRCASWRRSEPTYVAGHGQALHLLALPRPAQSDLRRQAVALGHTDLEQSSGPDPAPRRHERRPNGDGPRRLLSPAGRAHRQGEGHTPLRARSPNASTTCCSQASPTETPAPPSTPLVSASAPFARSASGTPRSASTYYPLPLRKWFLRSDEEYADLAGRPDASGSTPNPWIVPVASQRTG